MNFFKSTQNVLYLDLNLSILIAAHYDFFMTRSSIQKYSDLEKKSKFLIQVSFSLRTQNPSRGFSFAINYIASYNYNNSPQNYFPFDIYYS